MDKELSITVLGPIILPFLYKPKLSVEKSQDFTQSVGFSNAQRSIIVIVPDIDCVRICTKNTPHNRQVIKPARKMQRSVAAGVNLGRLWWILFSQKVNQLTSTAMVRISPKRRTIRLARRCMANSPRDVDTLLLSGCCCEILGSVDITRDARIMKRQPIISYVHSF
jgi:hypothetical protein